MSQQNLNQPEEETLAIEPEAEPIALEVDDEPISLTEEDGDIRRQKMRSFGTKTSDLDARKVELTRPLNKTAEGATRCKIFYSKISPGPLQHMQDIINEWLDTSDADVKQVAQVIGVMEGKRSEPNLITTIWY